jgi:O-antigen/teichoic acid export membrane protein
LGKSPTSNTIQAFWVAFGSLSSFIFSMLSAAVLSRYLEKSDYGTYRQILYVYNTLLVVFSAGLPSVFAYYLPRYSIAQGKDIVWKLTKMLFMLGMVFSFTLFLLSEVISDVLRNPELSRGLKYFSPIPMFLLPTIGIEGIFSTYKKTIYIAIFNIVSRFAILLCIIIPVIYFNGSYLQAVVGWISGSVISFAFALYFKYIPFKKVIIEESRLSLKEVFSYSIPLLIASIAGIVIRSSDLFYVGRYFGAEVFAEFSNGYFELPFVGMITVAVSTVLLPEFSRIISASQDYEKIVKLWRSTLVKSSMLIYPLVVFFVIYSKQVIYFLYTDTYSNSVYYFRIALVVNFFNIVIFSPLIFAMGRVKVYSYIHMMLAVLVWASEYLVVVIFNTPFAVAVTSSVMAIIKIVVFTYYSSRIIDVGILKLVPFTKMFILVIHSFLVIISIKMLTSNYMQNYNYIIVLSVSMILTFVLLLATGKYLKLDYISVIQPLLSRFTIKR